MRAMLPFVGALLELLGRHNESIPLDVAALQIAAIEFPNLSAAPTLDLLDGYAAEISKRLTPGAEGAEFVQVANEFLFGELRLRGNESDYYDPRNSCLNEVLARRTGIPISLAVIYIEVARRLERPVVGISLPRHFVVQYRDSRYATYIDPFHEGRLMSREDCIAMARRLSGVELEPQAAVWQPASKRQIILRMLGNLRLIYFQRQDYERATRVLDYLLEGLPDAAEEHKQRAVLYLQQRRYRAAMADLNRYLELLPEAADRADVEQQLKRIHRFLGSVN